jgi:hypothetical protein
VSGGCGGTVCGKLPTANNTEVTGHWPQIKNGYCVRIHAHMTGLNLDSENSTSLKSGESTPPDAHDAQLTVSSAPPSEIRVVREARSADSTMSTRLTSHSTQLWS